MEQQEGAAHQEQGTDGEEGEGQETEGVLCGTVSGVTQSDKLEDNIYRYQLISAYYNV